jgi:hypothetical protein
VPSPIPIPYPNIADFMQANPGTATKKVDTSFFKVFIKSTTIPMSTGDEAGSAGGVASGKIKGAAQFTTTSLKVKMENQPVCMLTKMMTMNDMNVPAGVHSVPSQTKVLIGE